MLRDRLENFSVGSIFPIARTPTKISYKEPSNAVHTHALH